MPPPAPTTDARFFLLSTLQFDVGTPVRLYGGFEVSTRTGLTFVLGKNMPWDPELLPASQVTTQIDEPFGMTGVRLQELNAVGRLYRGEGGSTEVDLTLVAAATFPNLPGFRLEGALVLENSSPRLALVHLTTEQPLTLTQFVTGVVGSTWDWMDGVTDQFAFLSGDLYYLRPPPDETDAYTYSYRASDGSTLLCSPGYHADAVLRIFGRYDFAIALAVVRLESGGNAVSLKTTLLTRIAFDFVVFENPSLELSTDPATGKYLRVSTDILLFGSPFLTVAAAYVVQRSAFVGSVRADLGRVSLPVVGGSETLDVTLGVEFAWANGGFRITRIDGLPSLDHNLIQQFAGYLNSMGGGCDKIVSDWLNSLAVTTLTPALDGSPSKSDGRMTVPLKVTYDLKAAGKSIATSVIPFPVVVEIPSSLNDLPRALFMSLVNSAEGIAKAMLSNEGTYKAMALYVGQRAGAQAMARLICRAVQQGMQNAARALADAAAGLAAETLAAAAELAGALAAVALMGFSTVISGFLDLLKKIWDKITGKDEEKRREAEEQIRAQGAQIQAALDRAVAAIDKARGDLALAALDVSVDAAGNYTATWSTNRYASLGEGATVTYTLTLREGAPGTAGAPWPGLKPVELPVNRSTWSTPLTSIPNASSFGMNASIVAVATGVTILTNGTRNALQDAIRRLNGVGNNVARDVANQLQRHLDQLVDANDRGIRSDPIYATLRAPATLVVGQSRVGVSTRLGTPPG